MENKNYLKFFAGACLFVLAFGYVGCGGGGSNLPLLPNPFAGSWSGTWSAATLGQNGTATVTIASDGGATGSIRNITLNLNGTLAGSISPTGSFTGTAQYPGQAAIGLAGTLTINSQGRLIGNLIQSIGAQTFSATFDLARQ